MHMWEQLETWHSSPGLLFHVLGSPEWFQVGVSGCQRGRAGSISPLLAVFVSELSHRGWNMGIPPWNSTTLAIVSPSPHCSGQSSTFSIAAEGVGAVRSKNPCPTERGAQFMPLFVV